MIRMSEKDKKEDSKGSWAEVQRDGMEKEVQKKEEQNDPWALIKKLDVMIGLQKEANKLQEKKITAINEATEATNALITTLVGQVRKPTKVEPKTSLEPSKTEEFLEIEKQAEDEVLLHNLFPADLQDYLEVIDEGDNMRVNIKEFLGGNNFGRANAIVTELHGKYVSAGKNSHWLVPKKITDMPVPKEQSKLPEASETKATPTGTTATQSTQISDIRAMFPEELGNLLMFAEEEDHITIKLRQFLGSENFAKIASIVRGIGGDYISAGKESHFRVAKK